MAQDAILKFNTILKAKEVEFPVSPKISQEAKVRFQIDSLEFQSIKKFADLIYWVKILGP